MADKRRSIRRVHSSLMREAPFFEGRIVGHHGIFGGVRLDRGGAGIEGIKRLQARRHLAGPHRCFGDGELKLLPFGLLPRDEIEADNRPLSHQSGSGTSAMHCIREANQIGLTMAETNSPSVPKAGPSNGTTMRQ